MKRALQWLGILAAFVMLMGIAARATETVTYTYDALGRLTQVQTSGGPNDGQNVTTTFDPAGNRTNYTVTGANQLSIANTSATEGSPLVFTVTLSSASSTTVTVNYASSDGTATAGSDYTAASGTLTFAPGETSKTISVATTDDSLVEGPETMTMALSSPTGANISSGTATGTINDNDTASLSIANTSATEGSNLVFTVTLSAASSSTVTVNYASSDGTATAPGDYTSTSGMLTFSPGQTSKTITVPTIDDSAVEAAETMTMTLSGPSVATLGTPSSAMGTINDNDTPSATLAIGNASVTEGGNLVFTVTRSGSTAGTASASYSTANGTAVAPGDYTSVTGGTVSFAVGQSTATITIATIDDSTVESAETMTVTLSSPVGATITTATGTGTINDNDASLAIGNASVTEGGNLVFTVTRTGSTAGTASAHYASTDGTAVAPGDYTAGAGTVSFAAGQSTATITVATIDDSTFESSETMTVTLSSPVGATITTATGTGTINDNDTWVGLSGGSPSTVEGGTLTFTVTRGGNTSGVSSVDFATSNGTATAGSDYTATSGTLTFAAGETTKTINVATIDDSIVESSVENLAVTLSNPVGATITNATIYGLINDNDSSLAIGNASVTEGGNLVFTVTRTGSTAGTASASYATASGTATSGSDFTAASGTVNFAAGQSTATITVATIDDSLVESPETMTVTLSSPVGATITTATGTGTINDNDASLAIGNASVTEGGNLVFTVTRTGSTAGTASAHYATANGSAAAGSDYTAASGTVNFAAGQSTATITIATIDDTIVESPETLTVTLSSPVGATITTATGTGTINDNDASLAIGNAGVTEGGNLVFTVTRTGSTAGTASASYATASGTATSGSDFTAASGTVNFAVGQSTATITVATIDDTAVESTETMTVTLSSPVGATITTATGTGTINDNDASPTLSIANATATEGSNLVFTVTLSAASSSTVTVNYASSNGTATAGSDYTAASGTLTFSPGQTSKTITVATIDDTTVEPTETMTMTLSGASGATISGPTGTGTINDNEPTQIAIQAGPTVTEGATLTFTVLRRGSLASTSSVHYETADGTAIAGSDYTPAYSTLNFAAGTEFPRKKVGGPSRNRTGVHGFAVRCVTTPPSGRPGARVGEGA